MKNKKIKILIYGMQNVRGGIEMYLYNLAKYCDYSKFSLTFLDTQKEGIIYQNEIKELGCSVEKITPSDIDFKACVKELKKLLHEKNYDYVYINVSSYSRFHFIVRMVKPKNTKMILHSHGMNNMKKKPLKSKISHYTGKIFFSGSNVLRAACSKDAGKFMFLNKPFKVFLNGIETDTFKYNESFRKEIRKEFNIEENEIVFGHIARLSPEKNHLFLIEIFSEILKLQPNSKLILVGEGVLRKEIENKIKELNIDSNVILTGSRQDAYKFYSALDAFIMPSISEGFGISIAEAQANGIFCFGSDVLDKSTDLTGNIKYIPLSSSAKEWAEIILENMKRDPNALEKFSKEFKAEESYRRIFEYFKEHV